MALVGLAAGASSAKTLIVAGSGTDGGACGAASAPCRSISQAIANAVDGDTISVGPGYYGDLDRDGTWDEPGEELGDANPSCDCVVEVDKRVTLISRDGAASTVIDGNGSAQVAIGVSAAGVTIGRAGHGFTLRGATERALSSLADDLRVGGNVAQANAGTGFYSVGQRAVFTGNRAEENGGDGIDLFGADSTSSSDLAQGNLGNGFSVQETHVQLRKDIAANNLVGFFIVEGIQHLLTHCAALGNRQAGIQTLTPGVELSSLSIVGNDAEAGTNCGVRYLGVDVVRITKSWFGSALGPGSDPGDALCTVGGGSIDATGFATKEVKVAPKAIK